MKSFFTTGLILLGITAWVAKAAHAQSDPSSNSLFPLATAASASPGVQPAAYQGATAPAPTPAAGTGGTFSANLSEAPCDAMEPCAADPVGKWYGVAMALAMTRNRAPATWTTAASNDPFDLRMNTQNAGADWAGGGQITIGYAWRGCNGPALAFTYWGLTTMNGSDVVNDTTGNPATALSGKINWGSITINGTPATTFFDNAQQQGVWRKDRTDNLELNLQSGTYTVGSLQAAGLIGFRYFRFAEDLTYGSASFGNSFSSNGGADAAYLNFQCQNNLYGGQVGSILSSVMTRRLTVFAVPKVGVYGNSMTNLQQIYAGNAQNAPDSHFYTYKTDVSVLSELDAGVTWAHNANVKFILGYRVISVTNLSLGDNQFGAYDHVEQGGSLILHGAFIGFNWIL